jgi:hypothetical protein
LIEIIKQNKIEESLKFAQEEIIPLASEKVKKKKIF